MPTYAYLCPECETQFEVNQKITEDPVKTCTKEGCKGEPKRMIVKTAFHLKGGGWYKDGY